MTVRLPLVVEVSQASLLFNVTPKNRNASGFSRKYFIFLVTHTVLLDIMFVKRNLLIDCVFLQKLHLLTYQVLAETTMNEPMGEAIDV